MAPQNMRIKNDENEKIIGKLQPLNKFGFTKDNVTKRAALGELGNRAVLRPVNKDGQKEIIEKPKMTLRTKASSNGVVIDSQVGKKLLTSSTAAFAAATKKVTRSNTLKGLTTTNTNIISSSTTNQIKKQPTSVTVKLGHIEKATVLHAKVIKKDEKKETVVTGLRREDSNLSQKSLSKLKAAISREQVKKLPIAIVAPSAKSKIIAPATSTTNESELSRIISSHSEKLIQQVENIDINDKKSPILVAEYVNDIYSYLHGLEVIFPIKEDFLEGQKNVTQKMRAVLIDWINEVHMQFHLIPETFQMTVSIIDRYLQVEKSTNREYLQLVGVTALFIASKYEELYPPAITDFIYITDNTYTKPQILTMELKILQALDWNLSRPLAIQFLRRCSKAAEAADYHHSMSKYFLELTSTEYSLAHYRPSEIAAASILLSLRLFNKVSALKDSDIWTPTLQYYSRYDIKALRPLVKKIAFIAKSAPNTKLRSVYQKYQSSKFNAISLRPELRGKTIDSILLEAEDKTI